MVRFPPLRGLLATAAYHARADFRHRTPEEVHVGMVIALWLPRAWRIENVFTGVGFDPHPDNLWAPPRVARRLSGIHLTLVPPRIGYLLTIPKSHFESIRHFAPLQRYCDPHSQLRCRLLPLQESRKRIGIVLLKGRALRSVTRRAALLACHVSC
jgi:hypothetical protein